jgi:hypothetical protein
MLHGTTVEIIETQVAGLYTNYRNTKLKLLKGATLMYILIYFFKTILKEFRRILKFH